jgi:lipopolysaccharide/colanic/teichoic acid biosynthesis glycosyltransferase
MPDAKISVIVPARDAAGTLESCLAGLANQTLPGADYEVIVVDDGSRDETARIARGHAQHVLRQAPLGPAAARNRGVQQAAGDLLIFTDADCAPAPDFLERLRAPFQDPDVAGARGVYRTRQRGWVPRFVQAEYAHKYDRAARRESIDFIDTYAAAYRRDVFLANGGFDARFPTASVEDQEFSFRLARKGYVLKFAPRAVVYHIHDQGPGAYVRRKYGIGFWKASLLRLHPDRLTGDSHTPVPERIQVALAPALALLVVATPLFPLAGRLALGGIGIFLLSGVPEMVSLARRDPALLVIFPLMSALRAAALAAGLIAGAVHPRPAVAGRRWPPLSPAQRLAKRAMDIALSAIGLVLSAPLILIAAVAISLEGQGGVFFRQERVGEGGKRFSMIKLRTMVPDAEARLDEALAGNVLDGPAFKIPDDPRVTRVGRFLRRWSLDELPQLWNVLKGEMSLVGPRPEEVRVVEQYDDRQRRRLAVPPGLTGPMQVAGRGLLDLEERLQMEIEYIEGYSLRRDIEILLRTVPALLEGEGAL